MPATTYAYVVVPLIVLAIIIAAILWVRASAARLNDIGPIKRDPSPEEDKPVGRMGGSATAEHWPAAHAATK